MPELNWQKSSFSGDDANRDCLEVATAPCGAALLLRESDTPGVVLHTASVSLWALREAARCDVLGHAR
ncbi:DUF397 domain-containing protein [Streptomyces acidicola]|uniref:DUF397 domain-containing protein n=1 Tax=Streptomyces acidicola TaxID=2596892 RepID=UPI0037876A3F